MTRERVKSEGEAETKDRSNEECTENHLLFKIDFPGWTNEKIDSRSNEHDAAK